MREVTETYKVYTFHTAPKEVKQLIVEDFTENGDLYWHCMQERVKTLEEYADYVGGFLDYSISCVPDRGEFITIKDYNHYLVSKSLGLKDCPFTDVCYGGELIELIKENIDGEMSLDLALTKYLKSIHDEYEAMLTPEYIGDLCEANGYEFTENGKIY